MSTLWCFIFLLPKQRSGEGAMAEWLGELGSGDRMVVGLGEQEKWNRERTAKPWVAAATGIGDRGGGTVVLSGEVILAMRGIWCKRDWGGLWPQCELEGVGATLQG